MTRFFLFDLWFCIIFIFFALNYRAKQAIKKLEERAANSNDEMSIVKLNKNGGSSAEYQEIEDFVMKNIVPMHNWWPTVIEIEKVTNWKVEKKYEEAKLKMKSMTMYAARKFHGTSNEGVIGITENGFRLPSPSIDNMYGAGIYFATDSSKSARPIYTKGSNKLLVCEVLLGKTLDVKGADKNLDLRELRRKGCDSVYAPRNSAGTNGRIGIQMFKKMKFFSLKTHFDLFKF